MPSLEKFTKRGSKWVIDKDPNAKLDYTLDFSRFLADDNDTIASAIALTTGGLVVETLSISPQSVVVWLSGGILTPEGGDYASLTVRITTIHTPERVEDRTVYFNMVEK